MDQNAYIDHPHGIPLQLKEALTPPPDSHATSPPTDLATIRCRWPRALIPGSQVVLSIPSLKPEFSQRVQVRWCKPSGSCYEVGLDALTPAGAFRLRMLEQLCHIHQYQTDMQRRHGRSLDTEQAAREWISLYAAEFPTYAT